VNLHIGDEDVRRGSLAKHQPPVKSVRATYISIRQEDVMLIELIKVETNAQVNEPWIHDVVAVALGGHKGIEGFLCCVEARRDVLPQKTPVPVSSSIYPAAHGEALWSPMAEIVSLAHVLHVPLRRPVQIWTRLQGKRGEVGEQGSGARAHGQALQSGGIQNGEALREGRARMLPDLGDLVDEAEGAGLKAGLVHEREELGANLQKFHLTPQPKGDRIRPMPSQLPRIKIADIADTAGSLNRIRTSPRNTKTPLGLAARGFRSLMQHRRTLLCRTLLCTAPRF